MCDTLRFFAKCIFRPLLHCHRRLDSRPWIVAFQPEVFVLEIEDRLDVRIYPHPGERTRLAGELRGYLLEVVPVDVRVTRGVHELAGLQAAHLRDHHREERIGGDIERDAQEDVGAALVQLAG